MRQARLAVFFIIFMPVMAAAATIDVAVGPGLVFDPASVTILPGDTVRWNFNGFHTTTSDSPTGPEVWDSGILSSGSFLHTFINPGDYPYYCSLHSVPAASGGTAMNGIVRVLAPPAVAITSVDPPAAAAGTTVTIRGSGFQAGAFVSFRGVASPTVTFVSSTELTAVVPNIAPGAAQVIVMNPDESSASFDNFAVAAAAVPVLSPAMLLLLAAVIAGAATVTLR